jgi:O-antigen/teichoic acid export membrane protein
MTTSRNAATAPLAQRILGETARFAALQALAAVLAWTANILLAKLLERRDFGVYGICSFYLGLGALVGDGGLGATLLRRKEEVSREEYRVALTSLLAVSGLMSGALMAAAPWIGRHNHLTAGETGVLRALAPLYVVSAFRMVPYIRLERALRFARIARIELVASVVRHLLAIGVALVKGGVWALVVSNLMGAALQLGLAYRASPGWVGLGWSWRVFRPLITYGSQVQALNVCAYLKDNISRALLGGALGPAAVGVFDFGLAYIQVPVTAVNSLARVQLPVYARLERSDPTLYTALRGAMRTAMVFGIPLLCALALASPWVVPTIYDTRWAAAYPVIWGLLANMVGGLVASPLFTLLQGQGRAGTAVGVFVGWTVTTWALAIASVLLAPGALGPVAMAHSVVTVAVVVGLTAWAGRHLRRGLFTSLVGPVAAGMLSLALGGVLSWKAPGAWGHPLVAALACMGSYFALLLGMERELVLGEFRTLLASLRKKRGAASSEQPAEAQKLPEAA